MCMMRSGKSEQVAVSMSNEMKCPVCDGTGKVETLKGAERYNIFCVWCPTCNGSGKIRVSG